MVEFVEFESLRRPDTPDHKDLREWQFRHKWWNNDSAVVLAWADDHGCVLHDAQCAHYSKEHEPTAKGQMLDARSLFAIEQPKGTFRYFGFCGNCLTERIPNYGWQPTEHDMLSLQNLRQRLNDMRLLGERPIGAREMIRRMKRYKGGEVTPKEFNRLLQFYRDNLQHDEMDLSDLIE